MCRNVLRNVKKVLKSVKSENVGMNRKKGRKCKKEYKYMEG